MGGFVHDGREWPFIIGSDVQRDGLYLEVQSPDEAVALEIFHADETGVMTIGAFQDHLPFEVVEAALRVAKTRLPLANR